MPRWLLPFNEAIDPNDLRGTWKTGIPEWLYKEVQIHGHEAKHARIAVIDEVLTRNGTIRLYRGWSRPGKDDCFVYVGQPEQDHRSLTIHTPAPKGMVFLVFVLTDGTIDDWGWRPAKPGQTEPEGVSGELIWQVNPD